MRILFVNLSALKFTAATPDHEPLGGSESAVCYLARVLARRGHEVAMANNLPEGRAADIDNIAHYPIEIIKDADFITSRKFAAIVLCNAPAAAAPIKQLSPNSRIIFWAHVLPDQPSMQLLKQAEAKNAIDATVFVSEWQRGEIERAFGAFPNAHVIGNGIAPAFENMFSSAADLIEAKQNHAAYTATPYRGLSVLARAMQGFDRDTKLNIFSSMKVYQATDDEYASLFDKLSQDPRIVRHGSVPQTALARHLRSSAFLFYPCIYPETFCIGAAEAMAAGMQIVATRLGALPETTMGYGELVPITSSDGDVLASAFREAMRRAVDEFTQNSTGWAQKMFAQCKRANETFSWAARASEWEKMLKI